MLPGSFLLESTAKEISQDSQGTSNTELTSQKSNVCLVTSMRSSSDMLKSSDVAGGRRFNVENSCDQRNTILIPAGEKHQEGRSNLESLLEGNTDYDVADFFESIKKQKACFGISNEDTSKKNHIYQNASDPKIILRMHNNFLTNKERSEILEFKEVWYWGTRRKCPSGKYNDETTEHQYDNEHGEYVASLHDHVAFRYELICTLGKGSFGQVFRAFDHKKCEHVALKMKRNNSTHNEQSYTEIKILKKILEKDSRNKYHVVHMKEHFEFRNHVCISYELLGTNLYSFLQKYNFRGFPGLALRSLAIQIVQALRFLKSQKIIHCDLKPENISLKTEHKTSLKVIDFGSSCIHGEKRFEYIQSRYYRSPEVILRLQYGNPIDMWSLGCILAELHTGHPLFPGDSEADQLTRMVEICGLPPFELIEESPQASKFFENDGTLKPYKNREGETRKIFFRRLEDVLKTKEKTFLDFLHGCLTWCPVKRMTPDEGMRHPWIKEFKKMKEEAERNRGKKKK